MFLFFGCSTFVIAAVSVVFPWSMCPIVPTFTCGFVRSYFALAMAETPSIRGLARSGARRRTARDLGHDLLGNGRGNFLVAGKLHGIGGAALRHRAQVGGVAEHLSERHRGPHDLGASPDFLG